MKTDVNISFGINCLLVDNSNTEQKNCVSDFLAELSSGQSSELIVGRLQCLLNQFCNFSHSIWTPFSRYLQRVAFDPMWFPGLE